MLTDANLIKRNDVHPRAFSRLWSKDHKVRFESGDDSRPLFQKKPKAGGRPVEFPLPMPVPKPHKLPQL